MGKQFLIDSNVIIDYLGGKIPVQNNDFMNTVINNIPAVSVISKIEVLGFNASVKELKILEDFFGDVLLLELNNRIVDQTILLRRTVKMKTPDAIIASTALIYNLTLLTRNIDDFKNIHGLELVDPYFL